MYEDWNFSVVIRDANPNMNNRKQEHEQTYKQNVQAEEILNRDN